MSPAIIFNVHLALGYVACLLCFRAYALPKLKSIDRIEAQRAIATLHSFRFFGLVFILPGVVGPNLPAAFATFAAYWDLATGLLAIAALLTVRIRPPLLDLCSRFQSRRNGRPDSRLLPRNPNRPSRDSGAVGGDVRDPGHLRPGADDHAHRGILFLASS
jgi:hypothetical protein